MPGVPNGSFWNGLSEEFSNALLRIILEVLFAGGESGLTLLPRGIAQVFDPDAFNTYAIDYLQRYRLETVDMISEYTRESSIKKIDGWIRSGDDMDALEQLLIPEFGADRARRIAVTEVTRIYADGNIGAWKSTGMVGGYRWNTANDERVCPVCGPLNGKVAGMGGNFLAWNEVTDAGITTKSPPAHVRCRCFLTPIVSVSQVMDEIEKAIREA